MHDFRSPPINIEDIGSVHLRMRARESDEIRLVRADIKIDGSTIFVTLCQAEEGWPFKIENDSDYSISMVQTVYNHHSILSTIVLMSGCP